MVKLIDIPYVLPLAEWIWGGDTTATTTAITCLDEIPFLGNDCLGRLVTKVCGVLIIAASMLNKIPIMRNMINSKSAAGISRNSLYGESMVYANYALYGFLSGFPLTAYGENISLLLQNAVLVVLAWRFAARTTGSSSPVPVREQAMVVTGFAAYVTAVVLVLPSDQRHLLMGSTWPVMLYARGSQILQTFSVGHTGNLSIITISMNLLGAIVRIGTNLMETGDMVVISGSLLAGSLSLMMFVQYWLYLSKTTEILEKDAKASSSSKKKEE